MTGIWPNLQVKEGAQHNVEFVLLQLQSSFRGERQINALSGRLVRACQVADSL